MDFDINELLSRLGPAATQADAEAAWQRAEDWYNATPKVEVLAWYEGLRRDDQHAADITDEDDSSQLVEDWNEKVIFYRAASQAVL